jgi:hypothetical protein
LASVTRSSAVPTRRINDLLMRHSRAGIQTILINDQPVDVVRTSFNNSKSVAMRLRFVCPECRRGCYTLHFVEKTWQCRKCGDLDYSSRRIAMTLRGLRVQVCAELRRHGHEKEARSIERRRPPRGL